jgi:hypothetical protein
MAWHDRDRERARIVRMTTTTEHYFMLDSEKTIGSVSKEHTTTD